MVTRFPAQNLREFTDYAWVTGVIMSAVAHIEYVCNVNKVDSSLPML